MKCIRAGNNGKITRVSDSIAHSSVQAGGAVYVAKSAWKKEVRDYTKPVIKKDKKGNKKKEDKNHDK